ncbi:MAG: tyrosine-type recombinase/integrase, partial [Nitrososphaera sp.]|nr:tyrosine-type recombinase/integrase [Nitrososphaera sp.]
MILLAPHLTAFLTERLSQELGVSDHTRDAYSYTFMLLLDYVSKQRKMAPSDLPLEAINTKTVLSFLEHIEKNRNNSVRSRNARLAAIRSFARYLEHKVPTAIEQVRCLLAIPSKRCHHKVVTYLTRAEIQSLLDAPNPRTIDGIRDRAMLHLAFSGGLRVSELINIRLSDLNLQGSPTVHVVGKGRKERVLP